MGKLLVTLLGMSWSPRRTPTRWSHYLMTTAAAVTGLKKKMGFDACADYVSERKLHSRTGLLPDASGLLQHV